MTKVEIFAALGDWKFQIFFKMLYKFLYAIKYLYNYNKS